MQANGYMEQFDMRYQGYMGDPMMMSQGYGYENEAMPFQRTTDLATALEASINFMEPLPEERAVHVDCIAQLEELVRQVGSGWEVKAFGSAANGFLSRGADLDVTCFKPDIQDQDSQMSVQELRFRFGPLLGKQPAFEVIQEIWSARVPIIKLRFMDIIDVDLSCHNPQALQNTYLLRGYASLDPRVRELVLCVKCWAKAENVCGAPLGHLSSYAFALMVIYFLQVDPMCNMPVLPVEGFTSEGPTLQMDQYAWTCPRPLSLILPRFFNFYANHFAWGSEVISIRVGRRRNAADTDFANLPGRQVHRLHIEDPFIARNLNSVLGPENEEFVRGRLQDAAMTLSNSEIPEAFLQADPQKWTKPSGPRYPVSMRMPSMQVQQKMWLQNMAMSENHQHFGNFQMEHRFYRQQYSSGRFQHKALPLQPHDARGNTAMWNAWNFEANGHNYHNSRGRGRQNADYSQVAVFDNSFQRKEPKYPPPDKPPKRPNLPSEKVALKKEAQTARAQKTSGPVPAIGPPRPPPPAPAKTSAAPFLAPAEPLEEKPTSPEKGRSTSSALEWLGPDKDSSPPAPVENQVPVPKFGIKM